MLTKRLAVSGRTGITAVIALGLLAAAPAGAQSAPAANMSLMRRITNADRKAAAGRAKAQAATAAPATPTLQKSVRGKAMTLAPSRSAALTTAPAMNPGGVPDVFGVGNYANSPLPSYVCSGDTTRSCFGDADCAATATLPAAGTCSVLDPANKAGIPKFVHTLPGLGPTNANDLGQYIPVAVSDANKYPGSDYYEIGVKTYAQPLYDPAVPVQLRGYYDKLNTSDSTPHYLGPFIIAQANKPVRIKFTNELPTSDQAAANLLIPVDTTVMGAGMGPDGVNSYTQNRANMHLHGGVTPWISDGTPHQWITPAGDPTPLKKGASFQNVPDMVNGTESAGDGAATYYYTNQQSGRLMWYHDHSYGITRLNVYAGEVAGYLLHDPLEDQLIADGILPNAGGVYTWGIPLVLQDKTFVPDATTQLPRQDPTWDLSRWGQPGDLWFPHVYVPNQNPYDPMGVNAFGRWDFGPWFWPPWVVSNPEICPVPPATGPCRPNLPNPSIVPEAFMDTALVNGQAYPTVTVQPQAYRFRILNGANDRSLNLSIFQADPTAPTELKMVPAFPHDATTTPVACQAGVTIGLPGYVTTDATGATVATNPAGGCWPSTWPTDGRDGGVPDPTLAGPSFIQIGTEGGFLPAPVVIDPTPVGYEYNRRNIVVLNVSTHALVLGPAERADVVVDFSAYAGKTLILYNDAPAPMPAFDTRYDYYTGDPDQTDSGGAPTTLPGYGPNTRTFMQIKVAAATPAAPFSVAKLNDAFSLNGGTASKGYGVFKNTQLAPVVPEAAYNSAYGRSDLTDLYARIQNVTGLSFTPIDPSNTPSFLDLKPKAIQELFDPMGRMNATLGSELPNTTGINQTTIPLGYVDRATDFTIDGQPQLWKITHNGVDTHSIHVHLFNVQLVNRVGWDGQVRPPDANELGWKETVRMSPLEDAIIAIRPVTAVVPFPLPDSIRLQDPTQAPGAPLTQFDPLSGANVTYANALMNFGAEYVWHCHLLGHEENDMMRPIVHLSAPEAPSNLVATANGPAVTGSFLDNSLSATSFVVQRATDAAFTSPVTLAPIPAPPHPLPFVAQSVPFADTVGTEPAYYYRVQAVKTIAGPYGPNTVTSAWSPTFQLGTSATATVSPTSFDFGTQLVHTTSTTTGTVTITAGGAGVLSLSLALTGTNLADFARTTTCGATLAGGSSCTVSVTFTPGALGARSATLAVTTSDPANPITFVALTGTGIGPIMSVSPTAIVFAGQALTTTSPASTVTIANTGTAPLALTGVALSGANASQFALANGCGATVAAGTSCTVAVTFTPTTLGAKTASLVVTSSDPVTPTASVSLSGTGTAATASVNPTSLTFAVQPIGTPSAAQTVVLSNAGTATLTLGGIAASGDFAQTTTCGASLAPGASCNISVTFTPTAAGTRTGAITITSNDLVNPTLAVPLTGTGTAVDLAPTALVFAGQLVGTTSASQQVRLLNTGGTPLMVNTIGFTGANAAMFSETDNCTTVAAHGSCAINVRFAPTASGPMTASLSVATSDPASPSTVALSGTGIAPVLSVAPAALTFSSPLNVSSAAQTVTVSNTGTAPLTVTSALLGGTNGNQFVVTNGCTAAVAPGASCNLTVAFLPTFYGGVLTKTGTLTVNGAAPATPATVSLTGTIVVPTYTVTPTSLTFAKQTVGTTSPAQTITVANTGAAPLGIRGITIGGTNATSFAQTNTCGASLAVGASCTIDVTFTPTRIGSRTATVNIRVASPAASQSVVLTGAGQ